MFTCRKLGVPCQKVAGTVPKFFGCRAHFSAGVNGALVACFSPANLVSRAFISTGEQHGGAKVLGT